MLHDAGDKNFFFQRLQTWALQNMYFSFPTKKASYILLVYLAL